MTIDNSRLPEAQLSLEAASEQGSFNDGIRDMLGIFSMAALEIEAAQEEVTKSQANVLLMKKVADALPHVSNERRKIADFNYDCGIFEFPNAQGLQRQYRAKRIQQNVMWLCDTNKFGEDEKRIAHFIIGRREQAQGGNKVTLLLLPAYKTVQKGSYAEQLGELLTCLKTVDVRKDDLKIRDELIDKSLTREYSAAERDLMLNRQTGMLEVHSRTPGSFVIDYATIGKSKMERVIEKGVRRTENTRYAREGLSDDFLEAYDVWPTLMNIVRAFDAADEVDALLKNPESWRPVSRERLLEDQNEALRQRLSQIMTAAGITTEDANKKLKQDFPFL